MSSERIAAKHSNHAPGVTIPRVDECVKADRFSDMSSVLPRCSVLSHFVRLASKWFFLILRTLFTPLYQLQIWQGLEQHSKQAIKVAYIGDLENRRYLQDLIFGKIPVATNCCSLYWWQLKRTIRNLDKDIDLSLMDVQFPVTVIFQKDGMLIVPRWVKQRVFIKPGWENVERGLRRKTRKEVRRLIRKHTYQARIVYGRNAAAMFYDRIYRPFVVKRYGAAALVVRRQQFLRECRYGQILELLHDDEVVAASLIRQTGNQLSIVWTGIKTDLDDKGHAGASDVLDYFSLRYAHQSGCDYLDLGPSRPRLNDGLLRYKKKWGGVLYTGKVPQGLFIVVPHNFTVAVQGMLAAAKFIMLERGRLVGKVLIPEDSDLDAIKKRFSKDWSNGLDFLRYYAWCAPSEMPKTDQRKIEFLSLSGSDDALAKFCRFGSY